ncbi:hypothetical protein BC628DRAFT_139142 [Trametes gibbosa]|nr:hypothetical protein BC628DRAFT_139142 [Trametes gibbosa]
MYLPPAVSVCSGIENISVTKNVHQPDRRSMHMMLASLRLSLGACDLLTLTLSVHSSPSTMSNLRVRGFQFTLVIVLPELRRNRNLGPMRSPSISLPLDTCNEPEDSAFGFSTAALIRPRLSGRTSDSNGINPLQIGRFCTERTCLSPAHAVLSNV